MRIKIFNSPVKCLCIILIIFPLLTGCWDRIEIEERAVVLAVAIDRAKNETEGKEEKTTHLSELKSTNQSDLIRLTVQIAVPGRIPLGPGDGGGKQSGGQTVWVLNAVGHSVEDALSNLQQTVSVPIFLGHLRIIAVSEELAREGLENVDDFFRRHPDIRRTTWLVVSKHRAELLLKANPELDRVPSLYLLSSLEQAVKMGKLPESFIGIFWRSVSKKGQDGMLPYIELEKTDNVMLKGLALFSFDKMVGATEPIDIGFFMALKGMNPGGYTVFVEVPGKKDQMVAFRATHRKSKIDVSIKNGRPNFNISVFIEGNIREKSDEQFLLNDDTLTLIEQELNKQAKKGFDDFIKKTQEYGSDILGLGEFVRARESKYWNSHIKTQAEWTAFYKDVEVDANVQVSVRRTGMKAR